MHTISPFPHGIRPWDAEVTERAHLLIPRDIDDVVSDRTVRLPDRLGKHLLPYPPAVDGEWLEQDDMATHIRLLIHRLTGQDSSHAEYGSSEYLDGHISAHNYIQSLIVHPSWRTEEPVGIGEVLACAHAIYDATPIPHLAISEVAYLLSRARTAFFESMYLGTRVTLSSKKKFAPQLSFLDSHWWDDVLTNRVSREQNPLAFDFGLKDSPTASGRNINWLVWLWLGAYLLVDVVDSVDPEKRYAHNMRGVTWEEAVSSFPVQRELFYRIDRLQRFEYHEVAPFLFAGIYDSELIADSISQGVDVDFVSATMRGMDDDR